MNKAAIKNFAIWARNKLIADIQYRAGLMGITAQGIKNALPQSTTNMEFYDIGTAEPYSITDNAIQQRQKLVEIIRSNFDLRPAGIIKMLDLRRPIYKQTAAYGHFGRNDLDLPWEKLDKVELLRSYL